MNKTHGFFVVEMLDGTKHRFTDGVIEAEGTFRWTLIMCDGTKVAAFRTKYIKAVYPSDV